MARRISSSRPMTGSSLPSAARAVKSTPYLVRGSSVSEMSGVLDLSTLGAVEWRGERRLEAVARR